MLSAWFGLFQIDTVNPVLLSLQADTAAFEEIKAPWFGAAPAVESESGKNEWNVGLLIVASIFIGAWLAFQVYLRCQRMRTSSVQEKSAEMQATGADSRPVAMDTPATSAEVALLRAEVQKVLVLLRDSKSSEGRVAQGAAS